jgi:hypothetical protein
MANDISGSNAKSVEFQNLLIVDPNPCGSESVNVEDLSISVELEVFRRSNEILIFNESEDTTTQVSSDNSETTRISFIDGSEENDKTLTTRYTELNSTFNKENPDLGTLGIESIDINFNTSYTPIVKIKFKDIRGKLFEMGENSPYSFLFRMPYPIFYLTVKGYYGKPVKYALHLTKFNGELDAETGSFIINCDFIGYTYAFLSDLLMGYLRAVPYMPEARPLPEGFTTFEQLQKSIKELEKFILNFKKNDDRLRALTVYDDLNSKLEGILGELKNSLNYSEDLIKLQNNSNNSNLIVYKPFTGDFGDELTNTYNNVLELVEKYNSFTKSSGAESYSLNKDKFELNGGGVYYKRFRVTHFLNRNFGSGNANTFLTYSEFLNNPTEILDLYGNFKRVEETEDENIGGSVTEVLYNNFINQLRNRPFVNENNIPTSNRYDIIDLRFAIQEINNIKNRINGQLEEKTNEVTNEFAGGLTQFFDNQSIDFNGSIGSFFRILCEHVDLFIKVIRNLGTEITKEVNNGTRTIEGTNKENFSEFDNFDNSPTIKIKPFPEYVEKEGDDLVEKWLGSNPKFDDFREVRFIDNLFNAILKADKIDEQVLDGSETLNKNWVPVNPLETKAFNRSNVNPWKGISELKKDEVTKLLYQRMMIFLGYSNKTLTNEQIYTMAKIEANQAYNALENPSVKLSFIKHEANTETIGNKLSNFRDVLEDKYGIRLFSDEADFFGLFGDDDTFVYRHDLKYQYLNIEDIDIEDAEPTYLPINQPESELKSGVNSLNVTNNRELAEYTFISSAVSGEAEYETFIKIINNNEYSNSFVYDSYVPAGGESIVKSFNLSRDSRESLKYNTNDVNIKEYNNFLGGIYKTHEFLSYENKKVGSLPLYYEFYESGIDVLKSFRNTNEDSQYDTFIENNDGFRYNTQVKNINRSEINSLNSVYPITTFKEKLLSNVKENFILNRSFKFEPTFKSNGKSYNLFGSKLYYEQSNIGKAYLFLHTLPFIGLGGKEDAYIKGLLVKKDLTFFNNSSGFVSVPYAWILFLGAILYRNEVKEDIISLDGNVPNFDGNPQVEKNRYLISGLYSRNLEFKDNGNGFESVNDVILNLPSSVKDQFINQFTQWVDNPNGWIQIKDSMEIFKDTASESEINSVWSNFNNFIPSYRNSSIIKSNVAENYYVISPDDEENNFILDIRDDSDASNKVIDFMLDNRIIVNSTHRIWQGSENTHENISAPSEYIETYLNSFLKEFSRLNKPTLNNETDNSKERIFKTNNEDDIKLSIYKNIKSIYDKWIVGIPQDKESTVVSDLYKRFNFIDRSYTDISDKFKIAPTTFVDFWKNNTNISFYNFIARILKDNNFDFIPLPTYIDYSSPKDVRDIFTPFRFNEEVGAKGPQFICMYFGEQSSQLNIDEKSKFKKNDSFAIDVKCNGDDINVNDGSSLPSDFSSGTTKIPYVLVNYSDQNQSVFKNYKLNQNEFVETQESLEIIDGLSNQNRNNSIGQNLFDVYNNRSYSAEIEMLGCAQVQPFMYFQLNNIPMFDGAYTIINTSHSIKPNHMTTTFKGVRIRSVKTKMIDDETLYSHLITNLDEVNRENSDLSKLERSDLNTDFENEIIKASSVVNNVNLQLLQGIVIEE